MLESGPDSVPENEQHSVICAWCDRPIREGKSGSISHGICLTCLGDKFSYAIENVALLNREVADLLPYGFIRLDEQGVVLEYNTAGIDALRPAPGRCCRQKLFPFRGSMHLREAVRGQSQGDDCQRKTGARSNSVSLQVSGPGHNGQSRHDLRSDPARSHTSYPEDPGTGQPQWERMIGPVSGPFLGRDRRWPPYSDPNINAGRGRFPAGNNCRRGRS